MVKEPGLISERTSEAVKKIREAKKLTLNDDKPLEIKSTQYEGGSSKFVSQQSKGNSVSSQESLSMSNKDLRPQMMRKTADHRNKLPNAADLSDELSDDGFSHSSFSRGTDSDFKP